MVTDWVSRRASLSPDRVAVVDLATDRRLTYRDMLWRTARLHGLLGAEGIRPGDRVGILARNQLAHLDLWLATGHAGITAVPLNCRLPLTELRPLAESARIRLLIFSDEFAAAARELSEATGAATLPLGPGAAAYEAALRAAVAAEPSPPAAGDVSMILFTGGTTGIAKGVRITHRQILFNAINTVTSWELGAMDTAPIFTPFYHTGGYHVLATPLYHAGGTALLGDGFEPKEALRAIRDERATLLFLVPTMFQRLLEAGPSPHDFRTVRFAISGGAPCPPWVEERFQALGVRFKQGYGLTEVGPNCFSMPLEEAAAHPGSVGVPVFHLEVRIVDPGGRPVPSGEPGELLLRGDTVADGYDGRPEETAEVFDADGFCHTGDLAIADGDGYVRIVGRRKDMYISGGENVYPVEVEAALQASPLVEAAAVVGVPDPVWGEVGVAFVQPRAGVELKAMDLRDFLAGRLARYKLPREVVVLSELPLTPAGKIAKQLLRTRFLTGRRPADAI